MEGVNLQQRLAYKDAPALTLEKHVLLVYISIFSTTNGILALPSTIRSNNINLKDAHVDSYHHVMRAQQLP